MPERILVRTYQNCSTCRDAVAWLRQHRLDFEEKPIYTQPPPLEELRRMLRCQGGELRRLFNTSGLEYRALGLKDTLPTLDQEQALALLAGNGRLVKRPFLLCGDVGLVGFKPEAWAEALAVR